MHVTLEAVEKQDDDSCLKSLIDIAESMPKFLRPQLEQIFGLCLKMINNQDLDENWRHLALEIVVTTAETAPAMVRKVVGGSVGPLVQACLQMMCDLEDEDDWAVSDEPQEEDSDSNAVVAESALDRIACGLGGKTVFPQIMNLTPGMLQQPDWKCRHAGLMAISASGEGCHKQMEPFLEQVMEGVMNYIADPHPRVRFACCNAIGQMSTDFAPVFENKFNEMVQKGTKLVLEQIVTTIASVADTAEDRFKEYYDKFMPNLKYMIGNATTPELRLLRGKTIECVSLIGLAVGAEKFAPDASEVMQLLLASQIKGEEMAEDDPQMSYMISAWARICKILGSGS